MFTTPTLTATAQLTPNWKSYQLSKPEIEFRVMEINVSGIMHVRMCMCKKDDICWQRRLNHSGMGGRGLDKKGDFPSNKDNYCCISSGWVHSSKCNSSPHSTMV